MEIHIPTGNGKTITLTLKSIATLMAVVGGLFSTFMWLTTNVVWANDFYKYKVGSEASLNAIQIDIAEERLYRARKENAPSADVDRYERKLDRLEKRQDHLEQLQIENQAPADN